MNILFFITILFFSLGQLGRISMFHQLVNFYLYEIPLLITFLYLIWFFKLKPIKQGLKNFKVIFGFVGVMLFSYLLNFSKFSSFQNFVSFLYLVRLLLYLGFWGYLAYYLKKKPRFAQTVFNGLIIFSLLTAISSFIQYFLYPDLRNLFYLGWDPHLYRMFGVFFDTSVAAAIYGLLFLFFIKSYKNYKSHKYYKILGTIFIPTFLLTVILTFSRSVYFALPIVVIYYFISQKKFSLVFAFLTVFLLLIFFVPKPFGEGVNLKRVFSIESRVNDYKHAINIWKRAPFFGIGYNRIRFVKQNSVDSHAASSFSSSYLIILVTGGILGLFGFIASLGKLWLINKKSRIFLLFLGLLSFTDNIILHPFIMFFLGLVMVDK
ncbi:MAG: O-antigen ligase family protein [Microgenomates group bacterium]